MLVSVTKDLQLNNLSAGAFTFFGIYEYKTGAVIIIELHKNYSYLGRDAINHVSTLERVTSSIVTKSSSEGSNTKEGVG